MKTRFILSTVIMCCAAAVLLSSCKKNDEVIYQKGYTYEVEMDMSSVGYTSSEAQSIMDAFNQAIGYDGTMYTSYSSPKDNEMKSACDAVSQRFRDLNSVYLVYTLYRITYDPTPGAEMITETVATYKFGRALTTPYVKYSFSSNEEDAYAALEAMRESLGDNYAAARRNLYVLAGRHSSTSSGFHETQSSVFEETLRNVIGHPFEENANDETYLRSVCDSIADVHSSDMMAVEVVVTLSKTGLLNGQKSDIWTRTFPVNLDK